MTQSKQPKEVIKNEIEGVRDYINEFLDTRNNGAYTSIDWLDNEDINFSITPIPLIDNGLLGRDVTGVERYQYTVQHSVVFNYSADVADMIENSTYFKQLSLWIKQQNKEGNFPIFDDSQIVEDVRITQSPYLFQTMPDNQKAQYTITISVYYKQQY